LEESQEDPTIVAVGFQEIVELSPQQIMSTDPKTRRVWEEAVKDCLNRHSEQKGTGKYVLLRSGQLVGAALLIYVKADVLGDIKNVEGSVKKASLALIRCMCLLYLLTGLRKDWSFGDCGQQRWMRHPFRIFKHADLLRYRASRRWIRQL